jgi:hypothetical protein
METRVVKLTGIARGKGKGKVIVWTVGTGKSPSRL